MHGRDDDAAATATGTPPGADPLSSLLFDRTDAELVEERRRLTTVLATVRRARAGVAACAGAMALATGATAVLLTTLGHGTDATLVVAVSVVVCATVSAICAVQSLLGWLRPGVSERRSVYRLAQIDQIAALRSSRSS